MEAGAPNPAIVAALAGRIDRGEQFTVSGLAAELGVTRGALAAAYDELVAQRGVDPLLERARESLRAAAAIDLVAR